MTVSNTEKTQRPAHGCSNFDRAVTRMQASGMRPFSPDVATCSTQRWLRDSDMPADVAANSARMDTIIAAFAAGVLLGWLIGGVA